MKKYYGIEGVKFINHGGWSDSELRYKGRLFNESLVSDALHTTWEELKEDGELTGKYLGEDGFDKWVVDNPDTVYGELNNLEFCAYEYVRDGVTLTKEQKKLFDKIEEDVIAFCRAGGDLRMVGNDLVAYNKKNADAYPEADFYMDERTCVLNSQFFWDIGQTLIPEFLDAEERVDKEVFRVKE